MEKEIKYRCNWAVGLSIASILASIVTLLVWLCNYQPVTWSLLDFASSFISMAIAAFVIAQIFHTFSLLSKIDDKNARLLGQVKEENDRLKADITKHLKDRMVSYDHNVQATVYQINAVNTHFVNQDYQNALELLMDALNKANIAKSGDFPEIENPAAGILSFITAIRNLDPPIKVSEEKAAVYCKILAKTGTDEAISLISYIQKIRNMAASSTNTNTVTPNNATKK